MLYHVIDQGPDEVPELKKVEIVVTNRKAYRALKVAANCLLSLQEDFSYREDVRRAIKAVTYLVNNIEFVQKIDGVINVISMED